MPKALPRWILALAMVAIGIDHFANPYPFVSIVPGFLPAHLALVYVSGFFEVAGGVGLLIPATRRAAAWGLIALYLAVFPANINMAVNHLRLGDAVVPPLLAWLRLPLQIVPIAWAWRYTKADDRVAA